MPLPIEPFLTLFACALIWLVDSYYERNDKYIRVSKDSILPTSISSQKNNHNKRVKINFNFNSKEDEFFYLLLLSAHFIEIHKEKDLLIDRDLELNFIEDYLKKYFEPYFINYLMSLLRKQLEHIKALYNYGREANNKLDYNIVQLTVIAQKELRYDTKLQMLNFINGLCFADDDFSPSENSNVEYWAKVIGISAKDYNKLKLSRWKKNFNANPLFKKYSDINDKEIAISDYIFWKKICPNSPSLEQFRHSLDKQDLILLYEKERKKMEAKTMLENTGLAGELTKKEKDAFFKLSEDLQLEYIKKLEEQVFASTDFIKLPAIQRHLSELDEELKAFTDIISKKLNPTDKRYIKYQDTVEKAYFMAIENINKLYQKIGKKKFGILLSEMPDNLDSILDIKKETIGTKEENKLSEFEEAVEDIKSVIETNSIAMDNIEELTMEVASLDNKDIEHSKVIEEAIKELDEWTDKVNLYQSRK